MSTQSQRVQALLHRHGRTFAAELGAPLERNTPSPLFQLLCLSLLTSAPVQASVAMSGARALAKAGWKSPRKMRESTWTQRTRTLNESGYARVDEKTASQLEEVTDALMTRYAGDLRKLRAEADGDPQAARRALQRFKGIGATGAGIFLREVQTVWPEFYPYADQAALKTAGELDLPSRADDLARLVSQRRFPELVAALVRTRLNKDLAAIREA
ncbi:endonuclease [Alloalcanivorax mobilis]|uniref:endonuclease n=1 Tax=Alloalcanivorax mobilis TaxID=2019569 RepID=UPI000C77F29A|nr:endonuclease [Alloalcanivorax mobilis]